MEDICEEYDCLQLHWAAPLLVTSSQNFETLVPFNKHLKQLTTQVYHEQMIYCCKPSSVHVLAGLHIIMFRGM